jgi:hypothetical protein
MKYMENLFYLTDKRRPDAPEFLIEVTKFVIATIVFLAPVIDLQTSPKSGVRRIAGTASDGALGWCLSVKQEKNPKHINYRLNVLYSRDKPCSVTFT